MLRTLLFLLFALSAVSAGAQQKNNLAKTTEKQGDAQKDYRDVGSYMPELRLIVCWDSLYKKEKPLRKNVRTNAEGNYVITNSDLERNANNFIMIFNPTCSHCEDETAMLEKHMDLFKKSGLYLMATPVMIPYAGDFIKMMKVNEYPKITVGIDSSGFLNNVFKYQALPQINIYDHEQKLIRVYSGEVDIDSLRQFIE